MVFRHRRYGRKTVPIADDTRVPSPMLKPVDEQNMDIQILSPLTASPSESRPSSSQEQYPDLASQMESFYHEEPSDSRRQSKVLSWINEGKDMLFEDTGNEQKFASKNLQRCYHVFHIGHIPMHIKSCKIQIKMLNVSSLRNCAHLQEVILQTFFKCGVCIYLEVFRDNFITTKHT